MFQKLEKYLYYFLLFAIPFQIRKIFWYSGWQFSEWQSISLYGTDIIIIILFGFWTLSKPKIGSIKHHEYLLLGFFLACLISIKNSSNPEISFYYLIKLGEFIIFYFYISRYALEKFGLYGSFISIFAGGVFQSIIAVLQFLIKSSLGLKYLGESVLNTDIIGVASFYLPTGEKILRAYGTTPHPNVLSAFIFLSLFSFYFVYLYHDIHQEKEGSGREKYLVISSTLVLFAFFTTFSRVVILAWLASFGVRAFWGLKKRTYRSVLGKKEIKRKLKVILWTSFSVVVFFNLVYLPEVVNRIMISGDDKALSERVFYAEQALKTNTNFFGVGIGNFVGWLKQKEPFLLSYIYQPVHNIYLLIYSEAGLVGLLLFVLFLILLIKNYINETKLIKFSHASYLVLFSSFLFIGFFDHFLWTLQQGRLIFWFLAGVLTFISKGDIIEGQ